MIENTLLTSYIIIICFSSNKQQSAVELASVCRIAHSALTWQVGEGADVANIFSVGLKQHIRLLLSWWEKGLAWRGFDYANPFPVGIKVQVIMLSSAQGDAALRIPPFASLSFPIKANSSLS